MITVPFSLLDKISLLTVSECVVLSRYFLVASSDVCVPYLDLALLPTTQKRNCNNPRRNRRHCSFIPVDPSDGSLKFCIFKSFARPLEDFRNCSKTRANAVARLQDPQNIHVPHSKQSRGELLTLRCSRAPGIPAFAFRMYRKPLTFTVAVRCTFGRRLLSTHYSRCPLGTSMMLLQEL